MEMTWADAETTASGGGVNRLAAAISDALATVATTGIGADDGGGIGMVANALSDAIAAKVAADC